MTSGREVALVTGASAGIGAAFAERLARDGYDLIVTARRRDRLEALAERLEEETGAEVEVVTADLSNDAERAGLEDRARTADRLTFLVNNAGFGGYRPFAELDPDEAERLIAVHVTSTVRLTRAVLPGMLGRGLGSVVNVASLLAFSGTLPSPPLPFRATYGAAKSFVVTFTQLLAGELAETPVRVMVCCPGVVETEFHEVQGMDMAHLTAMAPEDVVSAALRGLELGEVICAPPVEDAARLEAVGEAQRQVLFGSAGPGSSGQLAPRYRL